MQTSFGFSLRRCLIGMVAASIFLLISSLAIAQDCGGTGGPPPSNSGTEFLVCFMKNEAATYDETATNYQDIYFASVDTSKVTVTITCRAYPKLNKVFVLSNQTGLSGMWRVTTDPVINLAATGNDGIINSDEQIDSMVFRVVSTAPIACYGLNNKQFTADAFLAYPKNVAGTDYMILSYPSSNTGFFSSRNTWQPSEFCVAAFEDNTTFTIIPSAQTLNAGLPGVPVSYTLMAGECVQIQADINVPQSDLTGSTVTVNSIGKPIVVYAGHSRTECPTDFIHPDNSSSSRDHIAEAMPPITDWGSTFIIKNFGSKGRPVGDTVRVLALQANTVVKINGKVWGAPLGAGKFRDTSSGNAIDTGEMMTIESNPGPVMVGMIAHTSISSSNTVGDPFLANIPPLNQEYSDFTYVIMQDPTYTENFITVVAEQSGLNGIRIDNTPIPANLFTNVPNFTYLGKSYAVATVPQQGGIHHIVGPSGFIIVAYGWGNVISYGYTAGSLARHFIAIKQLPSPSHSTAPGNHFPIVPSIVVRDISNETVYFDSVQITYTDNPDDNTVRLKKDIALEIGTIYMAEEKTLELTTSKPVVNPVSGIVRIFYHTARWTDLNPVDFDFTINPQYAAGVGEDAAQNALLENYPNPSTSGMTTVHIIVPAGTYASVKIYDALGRIVRTVMQKVSQTGEEALQIGTRGLPVGDYTMELLVPERGISKHSHLIVLE